MRIRNIAVFSAAIFAGAVCGSLIGPRPVEAVAREIIDLQRDVTSLLQGQKDLSNQMTQDHTVIKTIVGGFNDSIGRLSGNMGSLQKSVQDMQANSGTRLDTMSTQVQGLSDNLEEIKSRLGKLNQQLVDLQNAVPAPSADTLYSNGLRDIQSGKYELARAEFQDYLKYYGKTDLASNAQFYIGEIAYRQKNYQQAIAEYDKVLNNYPRAIKVPPALLHRGMALVELGQKSSGIRDLREVVRRFPGSEEDRYARAKLKELGVAISASR